MSVTGIRESVLCLVTGIRESVLCLVTGIRESVLCLSLISGNLFCVCH